MQAHAAHSSSADPRYGSYTISDGELPAGSTLGAPQLCMVLKATGAVEQVWSVEAGAKMFGTLVLHHWDERTGIELGALAGTFNLHPERQEHAFSLSNDVGVRETLFALNTGFDAGDPPAAYYVLELRNDSEVEVAVATFAFCALPVRERTRIAYDEKLRAFVVRDSDEPRALRVFALSCRPSGHEVTDDRGKAVARRFPGRLSGETKMPRGEPIAVFHARSVLAPGASARLEYVLTFGIGARRDPARLLRALPSAADALERTREYYGRVLDRAVVLTPDSEVNRGVLWAKANMLRAELRTPTGPAFVNDPARSNNSVARDTAWFAFGADYLTPDFARDSLLAYVERQERGGMIPEYYDIRTGKCEDYGLDVNDNTPLIVLALWHHYSTGGDVAFLERVYPAAVKAARTLLAHRNRQGLIWCDSRETGARGIVGWRNVIPHYRLSGATTELNSEAFAALQTVGRMARVLERHDDAEKFLSAADELREAINTHLYDAQRGLYFLHIDVDGVARTDVSSDLVFPVMFGVAPENVAAGIISRLSGDDFWTEGGIRTVPRDAVEYGPTHGSGLLGGVWVGVTFWFAFAAARFNSEFMAYALATSFRHYSREPRRNNTVPGQFSEWLHGETLANQGMMLSPWFPPRYLWAAVEGAAGLDLTAGTPALKPRLAPDWKWLGVQNLPWHGAALTWLVVRTPDLRIYANAVFHEGVPAIAYDEDVSAALRCAGHAAVALGLRRDDALVLFVGNTVDRTISTALAFNDASTGRYAVRSYNSLHAEWFDEDDVSADALRRGIPLQIERRGFWLAELRQRT